MESMLPLLALAILFATADIFLRYYDRRNDYKLSRKERSRIMKLSSEATEMTPDEFRQLRKEAMQSAKGSSRSRRKRNDPSKIPGIYILLNQDRNLYYIGRSIDVLSRVYNHLSGRGNGDVYADFKYGDRFSIKIIPLKNSGFHSLNDLERDAIATYDSYYKGYNKTRGNR